MGGIVGGLLIGGLGSALSAGASTVVASGFAALTFKSLATSFLTGAVIGGLGAALSPKPNIPNFNQGAKARTVSVSDTAVPHQVVYGRQKVGGVIVFMHTTGENDFLHLVMAICPHEVTGIDQVFINDTLCFLDSNGDAQGKFTDLVHVEKFLGTSTQTVCTTLQAAAPALWTTNHRLRGIAYLYVRIKNDPGIFGSAIPTISCIVRGKKLYDGRTGLTTYSNNAALCIRDYLLDTTYGLGAASAEVDDAGWWNTEATECEDSITTNDEYNIAYPSTVSASSELTSGGDDPETYYAEQAFDYQEATYWKGVKSSTYLDMDFGSAVKLRRLKLTASAETQEDADSMPTGWTLYGSSTGAFAGEETSVNTQSSLSWSLGEVKTISFSNASSYRYYRLSFSGNNNQPNYIIVEIRPFTLQTSENRYTVNGSVATSVPIKTNLEQLLLSCSGKLVWSQGKWKLYVGQYRTPTVTIINDNLRDVVAIQVRHSKRDLFNRVKGVFVSEQTNWQPSDFTQVTNATYLTEDQEEQLYLDLALPFTTSNATAQRLAKIELEKIRQQMTCQVRCSLAAFETTVGDTVLMTNSQLGWSSKAFEVVEWALTVEENENGVPMMFVLLTLRETASSVFTWSTEETARDPAPDTNLPSGRKVSGIRSLVATSGNTELYADASGLVQSRIKVSWAAITDKFVSNGGYVEVYAKQTNTVVVPVGKGTRAVGPDLSYSLRARVKGDMTSAYITDVVDGGTYTIDVIAINQIGVKSKTASVTHTVSGKSEAPSNISRFLASQNGEGVNFVWTQVSDLDIAGYEIRYGYTTTTWANAKILTSATKTSIATSTGVPPGTWAFLIKAKDTSGNYSELATKYTTTIVNNAVVIGELQDTTFTGGTLSNFIKHWSDKLVPDSTMLASDMTDVQLWDTFVYSPYATCKYTTEVLDGGFDDTVRAWGTVLSKLGPGETTGTASQYFELFYRLAADPVSSASQEFNSISRTGTFTNCIYHWSDKIVPSSQTLASAMTDAQLWDTFVYNPYTTWSYEAPEIDLGSDRNVFFTSQVNEHGHPDETSITNGVYQIDYKSASGAYDGFETFTSGKLTTVRYIKQKISLTTDQGPTIVTELAPIVDSFELWDTIGEKTGRYFQGRVTMDTTQGVAYLDEVDFTVDLLEQKEKNQTVSIDAAGTAITFTNRFHSTPIVKVTPIGTASRIPVSTSISGTGFTVRVFDDAGTGVAATVDWEATGT